MDLQETARRHLERLRRLASVAAHAVAAACRALWRRAVAWFKAEFDITGALTWDKVARPRNLIYFAPVALWLGVLTLELLPARHHGWRSLVIVLTVALVVGSLRLGEERHPLGIMRGERLFIRIAAVLAAAQLLWCLYALIYPAPGGMATTTLTAARIMIAGGNPYAEPVDPTFEGPAVAEGYKLPPAMAVGYMPLGLVLGARGILLTNLLLQGLVAATLFAIARGEKERGRLDGVLALVLYLALPIVPIEIFGDGATDLLPVLLAMLGIFLADGRPFYGGLAAGLSCSASLLPCAAVLPLCIPSTTRGREAFLPGLIGGLAPALLFFLRAPQAFVYNVLGLGMDRVERPGSFVVGLSTPAMYFVQTVAGLLWLMLGLIAWRRPLELEQRCGLAAVVILSALLLLPTERPSETLWWLPLAAIAVARPVLLELTRLREGEQASNEASRMAARLRSLSGVEP